jgi:hypothetical protein
MLGVKTQTQNCFIYGELGRMPLRQTRLVKVIKYWFKILQSEEKKYRRHIYYLMLQDIERYPDKSSWATHVRNILEIYGFSDVWTNQGVANVNCFLNVFKQRVRDCFNPNWNEQINISKIANTYKLFADINFQFYLDTITIQMYRIAVTKLKVSSQSKLHDVTSHNQLM